MPGDTTVYRSRSGDPTANTLIDRLIEAWDGGAPVPLAELLPPDPAASVVADVACQEIALKLRAGRPVRVADYLAAYPQVAASDELVLYLLEAEVLGRKAHGPPPAPDEYVGQFPHLRAELERLFGVSRPALPQSPEGFDLLGEIGRGGMGVIYRARDKALKREVAIKVLQERFTPGSSVGQRFLEEAQITGQLQHPGIPAIHQVGTLSDGRPFLAMKLIEGQTLASLVKSKSEINTLGVFEAICQAVGYAHGRGVIHRDLKPGNVMVGAFGEVQVMDWGLAKVIGARPARPTAEARADASSTALEDPRTPERNDQTGVVGTPWYMAPEQAKGDQDKVDPRTDVFALGGILCAMLTDKPPIEGNEIEDVLANAVRSDMAATFARLDAAGAEPELVALCKECLAFRPDDRPHDAGELAKEVARLRTAAEDRARRAEVDKGKAEVEALAQRKRRKVLAWAGGIVVAVLLMGMTGTTFGLFQVREAKEREAARADGETRAKLKALDAEAAAEAEKELAIEFRNKALNALRATTSDDVEKLLGEKKELTTNEKEYLEAIAQRWQTFARQEGTDEQSRAIAAEGHFRVADLWQQLGRRDEARPKYEQAVALQMKLVADFPAVPEYRRELAKSHDGLGNLLANLDHRAEADEQYRKGLTLREKLAAEFPAVPEYRNELAKSHNHLGVLLGELRKGEEAQEQFKKALAVGEKLAAEFPAVPEYRSELAATHSNLGVLLAGLGKGDDAEGHYKMALFLQEKLAAEFPTVPQYCTELAATHSNLGILLIDLSKREEAEKQFKKGLVLREKMAADFPATPYYRSVLAMSHNNLGNLLEELEKEEEAEAQYKKGLALQEKLSSDFPAVPQYRTELAVLHLNLGSLLANLGRRTEAEKHYKMGLVLQEKMAADFPAVPLYREELAVIHGNLGNLLADLEKSAEAEQHLKMGMAKWEKLAADFPAVPKYRVELGGSYDNFGIFLRDDGKPDESLEWFEKAIETLRPVFEAEPRSASAKQLLQKGYWNRAMAYHKLGKYTDAVKDWDEMIELSSKEDQPTYRARRATSRLKAGQAAEAVAEVAELTRSSNWTADQWYAFASVYSVVSGKTADKKAEYANRAMELLQKAVKAGYKNHTHMKQDTDLDPLRDRNDFKKMLDDLEVKAPPKTPVPVPPKK